MRGSERVHGRLLLAGGIMALPLFGCSPTTQDTLVYDGGIASDSAGIRIVESFRPAWGPGESWQVDSVPETRLEPFGRNGLDVSSVAVARRLPGGDVTVVSGPPGLEIGVFDPGGRLLASFGGAGRGPGEFGFVPAIAVLGSDTVLAFDVSLRRYTWFTGDGRVARTRSIPQDAPTEALRGLTEIATPLLFHDGSVLVHGTVPPRAEYRPQPGGHLALPEAEWFDFSLRVVVLLPWGEGAIPLGEFPDSRRGFVTGGGAGRSTSLFLTDPFHAPALVTGSPTEPSLHVASHGTREIRSYTRNGELTRIVRQRVERSPVRPEDLQRFRSEVQRRATARTVPVGRALSLVDRLTVSDTLFAYTAIHADSAGYLWAEENRSSGKELPRSIQIFDPEGWWLGTVTLPVDGGRVEEIGNDYVLMVDDDSPQGSTLYLYRLHKPIHP